jgi:hypothetical protein
MIIGECTYFPGFSRTTFLSSAEQSHWTTNIFRFLKIFVRARRGLLPKTRSLLSTLTRFILQLNFLCVNSSLCNRIYVKYLLSCLLIIVKELFSLCFRILSPVIILNAVASGKVVLCGSLRRNDCASHRISRNECQFRCRS